MVQKRVVLYANRELHYLLERKSVKNLNLRVHKDCTVYVSANQDVAEEAVDDFVRRRGHHIRSAQKVFREMAQYASQPKQYVSGETFYLMGRSVRLSVQKDTQERIFSDGIYLYLSVKVPDDFAKKQRMVTRYLDEQCRVVFGRIIADIYPIFQKYGVTMPTLRIRNMETRWGSCLSAKKVITLNKRLLEVPQNCIEYVVTHEFCHLLHPNHSKQFYRFLTMLMPDWKARKVILDRSAMFGL